jgi:hypothetical protein
LGAAGVLTGAEARPVTESCPTFALVRSRLAARVRLVRANALTIFKRFWLFGFFGKLFKKIVFGNGFQHVCPYD